MAYLSQPHCTPSAHHKEQPCQIYAKKLSSRFLSFSDEGEWYWLLYLRHFDIKLKKTPTRVTATS